MPSHDVTVRPITLEFLAGGGEMGALMRAHDWSVSPLGDPATWPQSLRSVVQLMLSNRQLMFVAWGEELGFLYNDGYAPTFGQKHPWALGRPFRQVWSEIWDDVEPLVSRALGGEATWSENLHLVMERNGYPEDAWFTFSYSPLRDESGAVAGMFCAGIETTGQVLAERRLAAERDRQRKLFEQAPGFITILSGPELRFEFVNEAYDRLFGRRGFVGRTVRDVFPDLEGQPFFDLLDNAYATGERFVARAIPIRLQATPEAEVTDRFLDFIYEPVRDEAGGVTGLFIEGYDVTEAHVAQAALRESGERQRFLLDLGDAVRPLGDPPQLVAATTRALGERLGAARVAYADIDEGSDTASVAGDWSDGSVPRLPDRLRVSDYGDTLLATLRRGETLRVDDVRAHGATRDSLAALEAIGVGALVSVPLVKNGRFVANISVHRGRPHAWTNAEVELIEEVAERTWAAVGRARAQAALTSKAAELEAVLDAAPAAIWIARDPEARRIEGNAVARRLLRMGEIDNLSKTPPPGEAVPAHFRVLDSHGRELPSEDLPVQRAARGEEVRAFEEQVVFQDGTAVWLVGDARPLLDEAGRPRGAVASFVDITEHRRAGDALRDSEARYKALFEAIDAGFCVIDVIFDERGKATDYRFVETNPAFERQSGIIGAVGRRIREFAPDLEEIWFERYGRVALTGESFRVEDEAAALGRWFDINAFRTGAPEQRRVAVLVNDMTVRRKTEERLRELNADLERQVIERARERGRTWQVSPDLLCIFENDGRFDAVNPAWSVTLGWTQEELVGSLYSELLHPEDADPTLKTLEALQGDLPVVRFDNRYRSKDGSWRWLSWVAVPEGGKFYCSARDVTEEKAQAEALAASTAERDQLWTLSADMLARADYMGMMSAVSPSWTHVLGFSETELLTRPYSDFMHPDDTGATLDALTRMGETGAPVRFENRILTAAGEYKPIEWTVAPEPDGVNFIAVGRDLSLAKAREAELAAAQDALRQSQKMEAMGSLTGGVAHDFNNLLTPIVGALDMLQRKGVGGEREQRLISGAAQSAERARVLVQRLLAFARRQPLQPVAVDVVKLVQGMADLVSSTTGPQIRVVVDAPDDLPLAKADPNQLEMGLLNLAVNARDAMPDGGTLRISASMDTIRAGSNSRLRSGRYIRLSVADTGIGMDEATLKRAVEPFFSTKGIGKGTGLGLSMVHGLASQLGGALTITSKPGLGTNIEFWLPETEARPDAPAVTHEAESSRGRGTALLVDDEEFVRLSTSDMLGDLGYSVVEASSAEEALQVMGDGARIDLVVTDHLMPGMTGTDLARTLRDRRPDLPVLIVSGYAEVDGVAPDLPRLTKPFRKDELAASLTALLSSRSA